MLYRLSYQLGRVSRVLLVEDTDDLRDSFAKLLELVGCDVCAGPCGYAALDEVADSMPEPVLAGLMMPRMDGVELVRRLRAFPGLDHIPMVVLTANSTFTDERAARAAGATDVVIKPEDVIDALERYGHGAHH